MGHMGALCVGLYALSRWVHVGLSSSFPFIIILYYVILPRLDLDGFWCCSVGLLWISVQNTL
jgi:hypothetical protein